MNVSRLVGFGGVLFCVACGSGGGGSTEENGGEDGSTDTGGKNTQSPTKARASQPTSLALQASALPACNAERESQLVWVTDEKLFKYCKSGKWTTDQAPSSISGVKRYRFHTDTFVGQDNLKDGGPSDNIGTVQIALLPDLSAFIFVSGYVNDQLGGNDFSHSFFMPASATEQVYIAKFDNYVNARVRYKFSVGVDKVPKLAVAADSDGNFENNADWVIPLSAQ